MSRELDNALAKYDKTHGPYKSISIEKSKGFVAGWKARNEDVENLKSDLQVVLSELGETERWLDYYRQKSIRY